MNLYMIGKTEVRKTLTDQQNTGMSFRAQMNLLNSVLELWGIYVIH